MKPRFLLKIGLRGIINCNTFSVVPSIINENAKKRAIPLNSPFLKFSKNVEGATEKVYKFYKSLSKILSETSP
jgi:hypothetical protein